jgi:putative transposase
MMMNDAGKMIEKWHLQLPEKFNDIELDEYIVMPNHFHAIIINTDENVGADQRVRPENMNPDIVRPDNINPDFVRPDNINPDFVRPDNINPDFVRPDHMDPENVRPDHINPTVWGGHVGPPLPRIVQWFKTMTTNEYIRGVKNLGWDRFDGKLWQRNYYEHIIRDEKSYNAISEYIKNNPAKWIEDKFYNH